MRCELASIPSGGTFDASRVTPVLERMCSCSLPDRPLLLDVGTAAAPVCPYLNSIAALAAQARTSAYVFSNSEFEQTLTFVSNFWKKI